MAVESSINRLMDAFEEYAEGKAWTRGGGNPGPEAAALDDLEARLNEYIDARVDARLKAMTDAKAVPHAQ